MNKQFKVSFKHVDKEHDNWNFQLEKVDLSSGYLKDVMSEEYHSWTSERAVILSCPTGSGKTTFCEDCLIVDAIEKDKKVIFVSNRLSLNIAEKKRIMKKFNVDNVWNEKGLKAQTTFGENIIICTYQKLANLILEPKFAENVEYLILDEAHYFLADSGFSTIPSLLLKKIPKVFKQSIRVYMSATIKDVLPYICKQECLAGAARYALNHGFSQNFENILKILDVDERYRELQRGVYASKFPTPIIYEMPVDYNFLNLNFFNSDDDIVREINSSQEKWLVFVASKERGEELRCQIDDSFFIDSATKDTEAEYFEKLVDEEKFPNRVLISTSVFINGNNLFDDQLKNVVIYQVDETSIKQGLGRKRIPKGKASQVNLYLKIPPKKTLTQYLIKNEEIIKLAEAAEKDPSVLSRLMLTDSHNSGIVKKMIYTDKDGVYHFAEMCLEKLKSDMVLYKNLLSSLKEESGYCKAMAACFGLEFTQKMLKSKKTLEVILDEFSKKAIDKSPMNKEAYEEIVCEFNEIRKNNKLTIKNLDNLGSDRPIMTPKTFNDRAERMEYKLRVEKKDGDYYFFIKENDSVKE